RLLFGLINSVVDWYRADGPINGTELEEQAVSLLFNGLHTVNA
ncbi:TetR family transcriptional regulator, partial [Escherichia coli]|nr:TetR family transcriptional regulator [Escherichia coli]